MESGGGLHCGAMEQIVVELVAIEDPPEVQEANPVHGAGARAVGYDRPIVAGVSSYSWALRPALEFLGEGWFDCGWSEYSLRRPVFAGDVLRAVATSAGDGVCDFVLEGPDGKVAVQGRAGLGLAPWHDEWVLPVRREPVAVVADPPVVLPEDVPADTDLPPMAVHLSAEDMAEWASHRTGDPHRRYQPGPNQRVHPSWTPIQYVYLVRHSFRQPDVGIHVSGRVQNLQPLTPPVDVIVAGRWTTHELRNERWWSGATGVVQRPDGTELAYFSQVAILLPPFDLA